MVDYLRTAVYVGLSITIPVAVTVTICLVDHFVRVKPRVKHATKIRLQQHTGQRDGPGLEDADKTRPNISKQGFSAKKMDELESIGQFDAIIVGSGMSGLTTAALLSRRGWRVLCLEQHDVAGGCTHAFIEKGFEFDTGVHYIGGKVGDKRSMFGYMFDLLSSGQIRWNAYDKVFDRAQLSNINQSHDLSKEPLSHQISMEFANNPIDFERNLCNLFPDESKNIRDYMKLLGWSHFIPGILIALKLIPLSLGKYLRRYLKPLLDPFLSMTTHDVLQTISSNKVLTGCLSWCYGDYGLTPSQGAFLMNAMITNHYVDGGAYYPIDGTASIAASIIPIIEASGGKVFVRAKVSKLIMSSDMKRVIGVTVRGRDIYANIVVSSVGVLNTYMHLLPPSHPIVLKVKSMTKLEPTLQSKSLDTTNDTKILEPSCAMFSVFIGVTGSPKELGISKNNVWTFPEWDHKVAWDKYCDSVTRIRSYISDQLLSSTAVDDFDGNKAADYYFPLLFISSSTAKDVHYEDAERTSIELVTIVDFKSFIDLDDRGQDGKPGHRGTRYESMKGAVEGRLVSIVKDFYPQLRDRIAHVSSGSPLTSNFFLGTHYGEVYGLSHNCHRFNEQFDWLLRPQQPIQGLYMTGQDIFTDGVAGALMSGVVTAVALDWTVAPDLMTSYVVDYL